MSQNNTPAVDYTMPLLFLISLLMIAVVLIAAFMVPPELADRLTPTFIGVLTVMLPALAAVIIKKLNEAQVLRLEAKHVTEDTHKLVDGQATLLKEAAATATGLALDASAAAIQAAEDRGRSAGREEGRAEAVTALNAGVTAAVDKAEDAPPTGAPV